MSAPKKPAAKEDKALVPKRGRIPKLTDIHVAAIIDLTLNGYSASETVKFLTEEFGVTVDVRTIFKYRKTSKEKIMASMEEEIALARANMPELSTLTGRLKGLQEIIDKEKKKKRSSTYALVQAYSAADGAMYRAEVLRLRYRESMAKFPERRDDESERIMRELERRSHVMRDVTETTTRVMDAAAEEFGIDDKIQKKKNEDVIDVGAVDDSGVDDPEGIAEDEKGLGENAMLG